MALALLEAKAALQRWEVPVGCARRALARPCVAAALTPSLSPPFSCVLVRGGCVVASGANGPNAARDATRHAELEAADALLEHHGGDPDAADFPSCTLYVTCEPCISAQQRPPRVAVLLYCRLTRLHHHLHHRSRVRSVCRRPVSAARPPRRLRLRQRPVRGLRLSAGGRLRRRRRWRVRERRRFRSLAAAARPWRSPRGRVGGAAESVLSPRQPERREREGVCLLALTHTKRCC